MTTSLKGKREISKATRRTGFKIFSENEKAKNEAITSKGTIDLKGKLKNMSKIKGKRDSLENKFVERKALADLSNVTSNVSVKKAYDGSKPLKNERNAILERVSMPTAARTASVSSSKSFKGKGRDHLNQVPLGVQTSKTEGAKDLRTSLSYQSVKTKNGERKSVVTTSRITKISVPIRKSLPLLKKEKVTEASVSMAKTKIRESATQLANNAKNLHFRNRRSEGFVKMPPKVQSNAAAVILPRSLKPTVKTSLRVSNSQTTSRSKRSSVPRKPASVAVISSEKQDEVCSHQEDNAAVIPNEVIQRELHPSGNNDASRNMPVILDKKKAKRRRSYTSLLMAGPKLLDCSEVNKEENLPGIDNDRNPLEVAPYVDEIYQYYWVTEALDPPLENYMSIQTEITPRMRGILVNWLIEVHLKFDLMQETLYLMVSLLDRYISKVQIKKSDMQLVGLTSLLLASKYEDFWHPRVKELISISAETYSCEQMLKMEKHVLKSLKFRLNAPTPYVFMLRFLKAAQSDTKLEHLAFYLIELCLVEYEALKFKPSLLCASAMYVGRCTLQMTPYWTLLLSRHARYDVSEIRECAEMILKFQKAATSGQLRVTYEKYMSNDLGGVAAIEPLNTLPDCS